MVKYRLYTTTNNHQPSTNPSITIIHHHYLCYPTPTIQPLNIDHWPFTTSTINQQPWTCSPGWDWPCFLWMWRILRRSPVGRSASLVPCPLVETSCAKASVVVGMGVELVKMVVTVNTYNLATFSNYKCIQSGEGLVLRLFETAPKLIILRHLVKVVAKIWKKPVSDDLGISAVYIRVVQPNRFLLGAQSWGFGWPSFPSSCWRSRTRYITIFLPCPTAS